MEQQIRNKQQGAKRFELTEIASSLNCQNTKSLPNNLPDNNNIIKNTVHVCVNNKKIIVTVTYNIIKYLYI